MISINAGGHLNVDVYCKSNRTHAHTNKKPNIEERVVEQNKHITAWS